jgi:hypothetical protein
MGVEKMTGLSEIACLILGLLLQYSILVVFSHFLISCITIIISYSQKLNDTAVIIATSITAWVLPFLYTAVAAGLIVLVDGGADSVNVSFGYPKYCWINLSLSYIIFVPIILITLVRNNIINVIIIIYNRYSSLLYC